jgi:hypothetical protein
VYCGGGGMKRLVPAQLDTKSMSSKHTLLHPIYPPALCHSLSLCVSFTRRPSRESPAGIHPGARAGQVGVSRKDRAAGGFTAKGWQARCVDDQPPHLPRSLTLAAPQAGTLSAAPWPPKSSEPRWTFTGE